MVSYTAFACSNLAFDVSCMIVQTEWFGPPHGVLVLLLKVQEVEDLTGL